MHLFGWRHKDFGAGERPLGCLRGPSSPAIWGPAKYLVEVEVDGCPSPAQTAAGTSERKQSGGLTSKSFAK